LITLNGNSAEKSVNKLIIYYTFYSREKLGQTASTTVAYLKVLNPLFDRAIRVFQYQDPTFPKVQGVPDHREIDLIRYTVERLKPTFRGAGKKSNQETFNKIVLQKDSLLSFTLISEMFQTLRSELYCKLSQLVIIFNNTTAKVNVSSAVAGKKKQPRL